MDKVYTCCPPAEDAEFMDKIVDPIYASKTIPAHYADHPAFSS